MRTGIRTGFVALLMAMAVRAEWIQVAEDAMPGVRMIPAESGVIRVTCEVDGFDATPVIINGVEYQAIRLPGEPVMLEAGSPELPLLATSLIIPNTGKMDVRVLASRHVDLPLRVIPSKGNLTRDIDPATVPWTFGTAYQAQLWPDAQARLRDPYILRDFRGQTLLFQPFQVLPEEGLLRVFTHLEVELRPGAEPGINTLDQPRSAMVSAEFDLIYRERFLNYDHADESRYTQLVEQGRMLIICHDDFMDEMAPFVEWKRQTGMTVDLRPKSQVGTTAAAILSFVQTYYANPGLSFLLLVGDAEQIPSLSAAGGGSDPGYAMLAGADYYPDILVGRFSAATSAQVVTMVERCVEYERNPEQGAEWYARGLGIASAEGAGIGDDGESDIQHMNGIRTDLLGYNYSLVNQVYDPGASAASVSTAVNEGRSIINYVGHGSNTAWGTTGFSNTHVAALTNENRLPFIIDVACVNGNFVGTTCFAEAWMRATRNGNPTGAVGIYASTINQSWAPPMAAQDECTDLLVAESKLTFGGICFNGAMLMNDEYADYDMTRTWTIFTDPSLQVRTATPLPLMVSHIAAMLSTMSTLPVATGVAGARAALYGDGQLYGVATADNAGNASIALTTQPPVGAELVLTVTAYNHLSYQGTVSVIPPEGPFVAFESIQLAGDGLLIPAAQILASLNVRNLGVSDATNITLTLRSNDQACQVLDSLAGLDLLAPGAGATLESEFLLGTTMALPDGGAVSFTLVARDNAGGEWISAFSLTASAPRLEVAQVSVVDGGNGRLDPGESAQLLVQVRNAGSLACVDLNAVLGTQDDLLQLLDDQDTAMLILPGALVDLSYQVQVSPDATVGHAAIFSLDGSAQNTVLEQTLTLTVGLVIEDFESGDFSAFPWQQSGNQPWTVQSASVHAGTYAGKSGSIGHNQSSTLLMNADVLSAGTLSFWYRVSSEANYDYLRFYVDETQVAQWAGNVPWAEFSVQVAPGSHQFRWSYVKDNSVASGSDCAWLDDIIFPALSPPAAPEIVLSPTQVQVEVLPGQVADTQLVLQNIGTANLTWSLQIVTGEEWLTAAPLAGTLEAGLQQTIALTVGNPSLPQGTWTGQLNLSSNDASEGQILVPVTLLVAAPAIVSDLHISNGGNCQILLSWTTVPGVDAYRIWQSDSMDGDWIPVAETTENSWNVPCRTSGVWLFRITTLTN